MVKPWRGTAVCDGHDGLVLEKFTDAHAASLSKMTIDGVEYPSVMYEGQQFALIKTEQGWTSGGELANKQHEKNVILRLLTVGVRDGKGGIMFSRAEDLDIAERFAVGTVEIEGRDYPVIGQGDTLYPVNVATGAVN